MVVHAKRKVMTTETTRYYMQRLKAFLSIRVIADRLGVSSSTVQRWADEHTSPSIKYLVPFQSVLDGVYQSFMKETQEHGDFYSQICALLIEGVKEHGWPDEATEDTTRSNKIDLDYLDDALEKYLIAKQRVRSKVLIKFFEDRGYNRMQVYRSADRLKVIKKTTGLGRNMKSYWSLS